MTEISFSRTFLSALDARPVKISSDHVSDPKKLTGSFIYTIPRYPNAPPFGTQQTSIAPTDGSAPDETQAAGTQISLRNLKSPTFTLTTSLPAENTSIYDLKSAYSTHFTVPAEKIKVLDLSNKRPIPDSKLVSDFVIDGKDDVEFGIMLLGGVTPTVPSAAPAVDASSAEAAAAASKAEDVEMRDADTKDVLATQEFWSELEGWLDGKVGKEEGKRLVGVFKKATGR